MQQHMPTSSNGNTSWTCSFDVFFDMRLNKQLKKQLRRRWFETPWCPYDVTVMTYKCTPTVIHRVLLLLLLFCNVWNIVWIHTKMWKKLEHNTTKSWAFTVDVLHVFSATTKWSSQRPSWFVMFSCHILLYFKSNVPPLSILTFPVDGDVIKLGYSHITCQQHNINQR